VGCGIGGTSRYLASTALPNCAVTGITISGKQVQIATRLSKAASSSSSSSPSPSSPEGLQQQNGHRDDKDGAGFIPLGSQGGKVRFIELDAEKMGEYFGSDPSSSSSSSSSSPAVNHNNDNDNGKFDVVWISEALSHFPNKALFFRNAHALLRPGGKLVLADWFKAEGLDEAQFAADIKPIEGEPSRLNFFFLSQTLYTKLWGLVADNKGCTRWDAPPAAVHAAGLC
jgi:SAM-dependent methyltransferase